MTAADPRAAAMTENQLLAQVRNMCKQLGVLVYHTHRSDRSEPGFPDVVCVGPKAVLFVELKSTRGRVSDSQARWLAALSLAGQDTGVWRPQDFYDGTIARVLAEVAR